MPKGYRSVFVLHDVQGYEHEEVARRLGISIGTSKSQLHKARLKLRGLMFMPLAGLADDALREEFRRVRRLFEALRSSGHDCDTLSMGTSDDLEMAIAEGSTMVRVGTALFGARVAA